MHPNVYKKQHKTLQAIPLVIICMMTLCELVSSSQTCNLPVKSIDFYDTTAKGLLRIEGNKVVTSSAQNSDGELITITIEQHYMLLFHKKSEKFICWNKSFTKLVAKKNPTNLTYCKFEEKPSKYQQSWAVRLTTNHAGREIDIQFNMKGLPLNRKCLRNRKEEGKQRNHRRKISLTKMCSHLNRLGDQDFKRCCPNPTDFLPLSDGCVSRLYEFCVAMKNQKDKGRNVTPELRNLCKNEWNKD